MDRYWSQSLFLETRVNKFTKWEVLELNVEVGVSEMHFILTYFITGLPSQSILDGIADTGTLSKVAPKRKAETSLKPLSLKDGMQNSKLHSPVDPPIEEKNLDYTSNGT